MSRKEITRDKRVFPFCAREGHFCNREIASMLIEGPLSETTFSSQRAIARKRARELRVSVSAARASQRREMEAFRLRGGEISICGAIETKCYLFHIRHGPLRRIQWRGDVALPARTRHSIVDKSPRLTPVQISRTKREIDFHPS